MAKKSRSLSIIQSRIENLPIREAVGFNKRSAKKSARLAEQLSQFKARDIAKELGITTQKYNSIRRGMVSGKIADAGLNNYLDNALSNLSRTQIQPKGLRGEYTSEKPIRGKRKFKIDYVETGEKFIRSNVRWASRVKGPGSKQSILNWYGGITGGAGYFWIVKDKNGRYSVYDIRTASERARKGKAHKGLKAAKLIRSATHDKASTRRAGKRSRR